MINYDESPVKIKNPDMLLPHQEETTSKEFAAGVSLAVITLVAIGVMYAGWQLVGWLFS